MFLWTEMGRSAYCATPPVGLCSVTIQSIAFEKNDDVWVMDAKGSNRKNPD